MWYSLSSLDLIECFGTCIYIYIYIIVHIFLIGVYSVAQGFGLVDWMLLEQRFLTLFRRSCFTSRLTVYVPVRSKSVGWGSGQDSFLVLDSERRCCNDKQEEHLLTVATKSSRFSLTFKKIYDYSLSCWELAKKVDNPLESVRWKCLLVLQP